MEKPTDPSATQGGPPMYSPHQNAPSPAPQMGIPMQQMQPQQMHPQMQQPQMHQQMPQQMMPQQQMMQPQQTGMPPQQQPGGQQQYMYTGQQPMSPQGQGQGQGQQSPGMVQMNPMQAGGNPTQYKTATPLGALSASPSPVDCPSCGARALTMVNFTVGNTTHGWALGMCFCLCLGCIPYIINSLKDVEHKCGKCGVHLATWHRSGHSDVHVHS